MKRLRRAALGRGREGKGVRGRGGRKIYCMNRGMGLRDNSWDNLGIVLLCAKHNGTAIIAAAAIPR